MTDDQPGQHASKPPADPFGPMHASCVQVLELLRSYRAAGGGLIESVFMVAAIIVAGGKAETDKGTAGE